MAGRRYSNRLKIAFQINDLIVLNLSYFLSIYYFQAHLYFWNDSRQSIFLLLINLLWVVLTSYGDIYAIRRVILIDKELNRTFFVILFHFLITSIIVYFSKLIVFDSQDKFYFYSIFVVYMIIWKIISLKLLKILRVQGFNFRKIAIIGGGPVGNQIRSFLMSDHSFGFKYLGLFDDNPEKCIFKDEILGSVNDFREMATNLGIDEVFIALPNNAKRKIFELIHYCENNTIRIKMVPDFMRFIKPKVQLDFYGSIPIILLHNEPLESLKNRIIKRSFDIMFSLFMFIFVLSWLFPLLAILIKLDSKGPVLFKQKRTGLDNKEFNILKFRTMKMNLDSDKVQATKGDKRITRLGCFLRKTNLDEFPQFFNVLIGNMSIIGPRPHMLQHTAQYSALINEYMVRHLAKPGLTGWAQVNGFRGETNQPGQMEGRVEHDVYYIENWSVFLDLKIFFKTILNMLKGEENAG